MSKNLVACSMLVLSPILYGCATSGGLMQANNGYVYYIADPSKCNTYKSDPTGQSQLILCYDSDEKYVGELRALSQQEIISYHTQQIIREQQMNQFMSMLSNQINQMTASMNLQTQQNTMALLNSQIASNQRYIANNLQMFNKPHHRIPINRFLNSQNFYTGFSGSRAKYDLSDMSQREEYRLDLDAQMRDSLNTDVGVMLDRAMGQYGGGYF